MQSRLPARTGGCGQHDDLHDETASQALLLAPRPGFSTGTGEDICCAEMQRHDAIVIHQHSAGFVKHRCLNIRRGPLTLPALRMVATRGCPGEQKSTS